METNFDDQRQNEKENGQCFIRREQHECTLGAEVFVNLDHDSTCFDIFQMTAGLNELLQIIVTETNRYAKHKGCNFETM